jgi:hypothetical protein
LFHFSPKTKILSNFETDFFHSSVKPSSGNNE